MNEYPQIAAICMTFEEQARELERVAAEAANALRAQVAPNISVYELAEALRYAVTDDCSVAESLDQAQGIFDCVNQMRNGTRTPYHFADEIGKAHLALRKFGDPT